MLRVWRHASCAVVPMKPAFAVLRLGKPALAALRLGKPEGAASALLSTTKSPRWRKPELAGRFTGEKTGRGLRRAEDYAARRPRIRTAELANQDG